MRVFHDLSIRYKLTLLLLGVVSVVLLAVSVANVVWEVQNTRATLAAKYSTLAKIVAAQSGAALSIADVDKSGALQIVADFEAEPAIQFAVLIDANGDEVARYPADSPANPRLLPPRSPGAQFTSDGFLDVVDEIKVNGDKPIGRLFLRANTDELRVQIRRTTLIATIVYVAALAVALILSFFLQRFISEPILQLANLTRCVSTEHDYSLLAASHGKDELGVLCDGFNSMLAEIRRRDDELLKFNDELLRSNEELRQFAFVASHDLQEPLRSITSFCNLLKEECQDQLERPADDYIQRIVSAAKRMKDLVTDLLSYSRVNRDEQLTIDDVDFSDVVDDALANLQASLSETNATVTVDCLPIVQGDRVQLVQLMQNLIGNALKYHSDQPPSIHVAAQSNRNVWEFAVEDNGIGIAPEYHQQIFEVFKRLHGRDKYSGTGIGLAVCKKIIQRHGGEISVDSQLGAGSVFRFTIPAPAESAIHDREQLCATTI